MLDRDEKFTLCRDRAESGQTLIMFTLALIVLLGFVALTLDVGLAILERRSLQNAVDAAALAAAHDLANGKSDEAATAVALDYMSRNGFPDTAEIEVNIPPLSGTFAGQSGYVEVAGHSKAPTALLNLFLDDPLDVSARAVAVGTHETDGQGDTGDPGSLPPAVSLPPVTCGTAQVDGRVTNDESYVKIGDLLGGSADYGEVFYTCDSSYLYFGLRLNAVGPQGGVANENVYGEADYILGYNTGWTKAHALKQLVGSDRARFQVACDGVVGHDFIQDYIYQDKSSGDWVSGPAGDGTVLFNGPTASASSLEWNLEHPQETGWGDDPGEDMLLTSPPFIGTYGTWAPEYDGWVWEMLYEFKVPASAYAGCSTVQFGLHNFSGQAGQLEGIHSSPAKVSDGITLLIDTETKNLKLVE